MFCSKHVDVKRRSVYFPEIKKTFAVSTLVLNLLASQIGEFFLPYPVCCKFHSVQGTLEDNLDIGQTATKFVLWLMSKE